MSIVLSVLLILTASTGVRAQEPDPLVDPRRPLSAELETSIADGFTLAAVGDCIPARPHSQMLARDTEFAAIVEILRNADVAFGNFETSVFDIRRFEGYPQADEGGCWCLAPPEVTADLKSLGFDLFSRANNHALDWGLDGMRETSRWLDEAGLVHAGAGEHRGEARAPRYLETEMGRVALVSMASSYTSPSPAMPPLGAAPGRPGLNVIKTKRYTIVTSEMMRALVKLRDAIATERRSRNGTETGATPLSPSSDEVTNRLPEELSLFATEFRLGERPGYHYEMDAVDLEENLKSIRLGKQHSDFLIATMHAHQTDLGADEPGDFLPVLARAAIDAGADAFIGHGVHRLLPIEIYEGRPIFYSLSNFFWGDMQEPVAADYYEANREALAVVFEDPSRVTDADLNHLVNTSGYASELIFESVVALSRFEGGRVSEIRLYPVDLGYGRRLTESGVPRAASEEVGRRILQRLQRLSRPYGTTILLEENVGIIRPAADTLGQVGLVP